VPQLSPISQPTDLACLSVAGVDLYYNDALGNQVRITQGGGIAGSPGSITGLVAPASAAYDAGNAKFIWESDVDTPAAMDGGPVTIREIAANAEGITLQSPAALPASYSLTLPTTLPSTADSLLLTDTSGVQSYLAKGNAYQLLGMDSSGTSLGYLTQVQRSNLPTVGQQISGSSGNFSTSSTGYVDVTNLSVTITTNGRPVVLGLLWDGTAGTGGAAKIGGSVSGSNSVGVHFAIVRDGSTMVWQGNLTLSTGGSNQTIYTAPPSGILVPISAGTYTFKFQAYGASAASNTAFVSNCVMYVYEL